MPQPEPTSAPTLPGVDYPLLLAKYIEHVGQCEGADFVDDPHSNVVFTADEMKALIAARSIFSKGT